MSSGHRLCNDRSGTETAVSDRIRNYEVNKQCAEAIVVFYKIENVRFKHYAALKTFGMDKYSRIKRNEMEENAPELMEWLDDLIGDKKQSEAAYRWLQRGLRLSDAARLAFVQMEISYNSAKSRW